MDYIGDIIFTFNVSLSFSDNNVMPLDALASLFLVSYVSQ